MYYYYYFSKNNSRSRHVAAEGENPVSVDLQGFLIAFALGREGGR